MLSASALQDAEACRRLARCLSGLRGPLLKLSIRPTVAETSPRDKFRGMTVNERLFAAGLLGDFDEAARRRDRRKMIDILTQVGDDTPERTTDTILRNPETYGF